MRIVASIGERVAARMPEHMRVSLEGIAISNRLRATPRWPKGGSRGSGRTIFRAETNGKASIGEGSRPFVGAQQRLNVGCFLRGLSLRDLSANQRGW